MIKQETAISSFDLEKQENLSKERLEKLFVVPKNNLTHPPRPQTNMIDLMNWAIKEFENELSGTNKSSYIHGSIVVDGQFAYYAEQNKINIQCLLKDSIVSWNTENDFEKFILTGVFKIRKGELEFLQCSLYHKGMHNEDQMAFFNIVDNSNYDKYISFRNEYEKWTLFRDRSNLEVHVVDGENIPYDRSMSWDDVFLYDDIKNDIKSCVEGFLGSKDFHNKMNIPWKKGIILYGQTGVGKTTVIKTIISNYNFKPITVSACSCDEAIQEAFAVAEEMSPALLYIEDFDSMINNIDLKAFLNLMDGISSKNGIFVIATANNIAKLPLSIIDRPSRFDRKFEIGLPDAKMSFAYLKKYFGNNVSDKKLQEVADVLAANYFSYAYLKELYIAAVYNAFANNRKAPNASDVDVAKDQLFKDKVSQKKENKNFGIDKYLNKGKGK